MHRWLLSLSKYGTGVPVVKAEIAGRHGKGEDGIAKTREVKLGCVFTQTTVDDEGSPIRDENSTSYVGAIERADEFGKRIYGEAMRCGLQRAGKHCVIGDGAPWIWNIARVVWGNDKEKMNRWAKKRHDELDKGKVEDVIKAIRKLSPSTDYEKDICEKEVNYFEKNKDRMRYAEFRRQGLFVGSGVLEAGCRTVVGQRLKQSGMHWTVKGANSIIALRCCFLSNRWVDFWEDRACA